MCATGRCGCDQRRQLIDCVDLSRPHKHTSDTTIDVLGSSSPPQEIFLQPTAREQWHGSHSIIRQPVYPSVAVYPIVHPKSARWTILLEEVDERSFEPMVIDSSNTLAARPSALRAEREKRNRYQGLKSLATIVRPNGRRLKTQCQGLSLLLTRLATAKESAPPALNKIAHEALANPLPRFKI